MISKTSLYLDVPGEISLPMGWTLHTERVTNSQSTYRQALMNADPFQAWVDAENIKIPLVVRSRCPGERFFPLGMHNHSLKLADFMINVKVPRRARMAWPLVCSGPDILWVPGYRLGHTHRLQQTTRRAIYLQLSRIY
jgi:tRNA(Ile)-lysidine synthase